MSPAERKNWWGYVASLAGVAAVTVLFKVVIPEVNNTTVALSYLLVVLVSASAHGLRPAILASVSGVICFNYFFLPPVGSFTIDDPQNWVALTAFLVTAFIASKLSAAASARAREAESRREQVWKLYELSRAIIVTPDSETAIASIARQVLDVFGASHCSVFVTDEGAGARQVATAQREGEVDFQASPALLEAAFRAGEVQFVEPAPASDKTPGRRSLVYAPLKVGVRPTGVMVLISAPLELGTIEATAGLVAIALERARFLKEVGRTEALRQSDELKSALLASVSHGLRTPLTSIRAAVDNLLERDLAWEKEALSEFHLIIREEVERLTRLVTNLLEMARIEAGELRLSKQWGSVSEIFGNVLERCSGRLRSHQVSAGLSDAMPLVMVDSRLVAEALANLVENAAKYSPPGSRITLEARAGDGELLISVTDEGPGIAPDEVRRVFDKFYRSPSTSRSSGSGTGMGLAITRGIIEAHGGRVWAESPPRHGAAFHGATFAFAIPVECKDVSAEIPAGTTL